SARRPLNRFFLRLDLDHPVSAEHFFGLGEGAVGDFRLPACEADARAHRGRMQSVEREQHAGFLQLFVVLHHLFDGVGFRHRSRLGGFVTLRDHQHHESHVVLLPSYCCFETISARRRSSCSRSSGVNSAPKSSASKIGRISISDSWPNFARSSGVPVFGFGQRFTHSIASSIDFTFHSQKPAISSLVSANGPSMTVVFPPAKRTRAPFELGCRPSPACMIPAWTSSSLYFPMSVRSFSSGSTPASDCSLALMMTMTRIVISPSCFSWLHYHVERAPP